MITGVPRSGAATLADALAEVDSRLSVAVARPDAVGASGAVVGLLVVEPSSMCGADDRAALHALRDAVGHVAVVVTKVDAFWDWPTVARSSRAALDPYEELPVFAVSAAAALAGAVDESGVDALAGWIRERLIDGRVVPRPAVDDSPGRTRADELAALRARRARVVRGRDRGRTDRLAAVRGGLGRIRTSASAETVAGLRDVVEESDAVVAHLRGGGVAAHRRWLHERVAHLQTQVLAGVDDELDRLRAAVLLGVEPFRPEPPAPASPIVVRDPPPVGAPTEEIVGVLLGAASGFAVARFLVEPFTEVEVVHQISTPLALVVGAVIGLVITTVRRRAATRARVRSATNAALAEARSVIDQDVAVRLADAESLISGRVVRHAERRAVEAAREVSALDERIRALGGARDPGGTRGTDRRPAASNAREAPAPGVPEPAGPRRSETT
ncbi:hypothetical protein LX14_001739 [Williamsia deligens]|nr:hypothetical protein [Williamsia deligens]